MRIKNFHVIGRTTGALLLLLAAPAGLRAGALEDIVNDFQKFSNDKTPFGVTDGNPQAATAFFSTDAFSHFGLEPSLGMAPKDHDGFQVGLTTSGAAIDTKSIDEWYATADLYMAWRFTDTIGLAISLPFEYRSTHDVGTYIAGITVGLPITLINGHKGDYSWALTPWGTAAGLGMSVDLAQGGYLFGGGLTSNLNRRFGDLTLTLANQIAYDAGFPIAYSSEFQFEQNVSEFLVKNGLKATYDFDKKFYGDAGVVYTNFLNGAYTDNYFTFTAGLGMRFGPASGLRVGYEGDADFSNQYYTYGGKVELYFAF